MDSTITVAGHLTRDPNIRYTAGGSAVCNFTVASNRRFQKNNEWTETVAFLDCVAMGSLGENIAGSMHKGERILVMGRMEQRSWEDQGGEAHTKLEVFVEEGGPSLRSATAEVEKNPRKDDR